jgi:hypothetical protein
MSRILPLNPPFEGLSAIVNVLQKVGPNETNNTDDVRVVQELLQMCAKGADPVKASIGFPKVTGHFDAATGFWVFHTQNKHRKTRPNQIVDGVVSPAHGVTYAAGAAWTIVAFNYIASLQDPINYAKFVASKS